MTSEAPCTVITDWQAIRFGAALVVEDSTTLIVHSVSAKSLHASPAEMENVTDMTDIVSCPTRSKETGYSNVL